MDLSDLVCEILSPLGLPVEHMTRPEDTPCISYHFFNEGGILYGGGTEKVSGGSLQVDIFGAENLRAIRRRVVKTLTGYKGDVVFIKTTPDECSIESAEKLYHHVVVFEFAYLTESEVF